jgi:DNA-binding response OmpR family regulator
MKKIALIWVAETNHALVSTLRKSYDIQLVRSGKHALELLKESKFALIIVDAVSLKTSGLRICKQLRRAMPRIPILLLSENLSIEDTVVDSVLTLPMTARQIENAVKRLMRPTPNAIRCGAFVLDLDHRLLQVGGREVTLNPKQSQLLEAFFRRPNQVIERSWLMKQVWETDYVGDTRTLDVHIRWVRQALGVLPSPLKTIRGVGYCLEINEEKRQ